MSSTRSASLEVPVFALPREGDLGCGDTRAIHDLLELARELDLQCLTLLPIQETAGDLDPGHAISLYALDPLYIDVSPAALEDLQPADHARLINGLDPAAGGAPIDYAGVKKAKLDLLWQAFTHFWENHYLLGTRRAGPFHRFCRRERRWLPDYALYRMLMDFEEGRTQWETWSPRYASYAHGRQFVADIALRDPAAVERQLAFYAYVQWIAEEQWGRVHAHAQRLGIRLATDIHCLIPPHSAEVYQDPESYHTENHQGRPLALCRANLLNHLEGRLRRFSSIFDRFRVRDFPTAVGRLPQDLTLQRFAASLKTSPASTPGAAKVTWEALPSLTMRAEPLWPAPNGQLTPPDRSPQMSFLPFGAPSLRHLWHHDARFRHRLKTQWAVEPKVYDLRATLSLLRKLFQYPAGTVQITYADLAGLEPSQEPLWLQRYAQGPRDLMQRPDWPRFRREFRKMLRETARQAEAAEKHAESV